MYMNTLEIARKFVRLGQNKEAVAAYKLALNDVKGADNAAELEAALYILQFGAANDYKVSYTCFLDLYSQGFARDEILAIMNGAFYQPNIKRLQKRYEKNCKLLAKYPYIFRHDFPAFADLPIIFFPYADDQYTPYEAAAQRFGDFYAPREQVVSRNFFKDLTNPVLAADVFSQYELEYLNDNVRKSEYVARENHIYLHYTDWRVFCAYLQCLDLQPILKDNKIVFLIEDEIEQYPLDFKRRFGVDYSQYELRPLGIREVNRLIWHTQLSSDNGGDYFNEIFDMHPNLLVLPSMMFDDNREKIYRYEKIMRKSPDLPTAQEQLSGWQSPEIIAKLYHLRNRTFKDWLVAMFICNVKQLPAYLDTASRIVPAVFFQPHFHNINYELKRNNLGQLMLYSEQYEEIQQSPFFHAFKYIKTFTPMRCISSAHAATVKYKNYRVGLHKAGESIMDDTLLGRVKNRSFMIDWQDRLFMDCRLVRFEDAKLNRVATFTALAAFLDLPYTESMEYCSVFGERDPLSDVGNDRGFSPATIYRKNAEYANDAERAFIEFCMRDVYKYYGYDFEYYDGQPVDEEKLKDWLTKFTTLDSFMRSTMRTYVEHKVFEVSTDDELAESPEETKKNFLDSAEQGYMESINAHRLAVGEVFLQDNLNFVNRNGQPLHMMPLLEPDPALLVMPLYRSTTYPKVDVEVKEFSHKEMKPLEETN